MYTACVCIKLVFYVHGLWYYQIYEPNYTCFWFTLKHGKSTESRSMGCPRISFDWVNSQYTPVSLEYCYLLTHDHLCSREDSLLLRVAPNS